MFKNRKYPTKNLILHPDLDVQYCNPIYTLLVESNELTISITRKHDPYKNAIANRINRTLKYKYSLKLIIENTTLAQRMTKELFMLTTTYKHI